MVLRISASDGDGPGRLANALSAAVTINSMESTSVPSRSNRTVGALDDTATSVGNRSAGLSQARRRMPAPELAQVVREVSGHEVRREVACGRKGALGQRVGIGHGEDIIRRARR